MAAFESEFVSLDTAQQVQYASLIDSVYTPWRDARTMDAALVARLTQIRNTLVGLLNTRVFSDTTFFALEYLVYVIDGDRATYVPPAPVVTTPRVISTVTNTVPVPPTPAPAPTMTVTAPAPSVTITPTPVVPATSAPRIDISTYQQGTKTVLWWTSTDALIRFELIASLEGMIIQDLDLRSSTQDFGVAVETVYLYDAQGFLIARTNPSSNTASFRELFLEIPVGQTDLYFAFDTAPIGFNHPAPSSVTMWFELRVREGYGIVSGNDQTPIQSSDDVVTTVPTQITDVQLVDRFENRAVDNVLTSGTATLGIVAITTKWSRDNIDTTDGSRLQTVIESIKLVVDDNTSAGDLASTLNLSELNGSIFVPAAVNNFWEVEFDLNSLGTDAWIQNNSTKAYVITWNPTLSSSNVTETVRISIDDLDNGGITYTTTDPTSPSITDLWLPYRFLNGDVISE